jgi:multidrug efflux system membrane fusion protein
VKKLVLILIVLVVGGAGAWYIDGSKAKSLGSSATPGAEGSTKTVAAKSGADEKGGAAKKGGRGGGPVGVLVTQVKVQPMPVVVDAVGAVEPEQSVAVRPQASGILEAVMFKEGDRVARGQLLFRIDNRPMQASLDQSRAALARDQAQLEMARAQEARLRPLLDKDYITRQEYEVAATSAKALEATVAANKAIVEQALVNMSYTEIRAPIAGRTGALTVKAGNLVSAGTSGAPLVVINSTEPILVGFSLPQHELNEVRGYAKEAKVEVRLDKNAEPVAVGPIVFIDNLVNQQTGTILLKSRVVNKAEQLWPGQFVEVRIVLRTDPDAVVVPEAAVHPGQEGPFVYLVRDGRVQLQNVKVARQLGQSIVIGGGLKGGETVVTESQDGLAPGTQVRVAGAEGAAKRAANDAAKGEGGKGRIGEGGKAQ